MTVCLFVRLSVFLYVCLSVCLSVCFFVCMSVIGLSDCVWLSVFYSYFFELKKLQRLDRYNITSRDCLITCLSNCVSMRIYGCLFICQSACKSVGLSVFLFLCRSYIRHCLFLLNLASATGSIKCSESGLYPQPGSCRSYYICVRHGSRWYKFHLTCPQGLAFRADTAACGIVDNCNS